MTEFDRKVGEASTRFNRSMSNIAETLEKETAELVTYLNNEVVPAVRTHSSKALPDRGRQTRQVRGLSGRTAQEFLIHLSTQRPAQPHAEPRRLPCFLFLLLLGTVFIGVRGHKHTQAQGSLRHLHFPQEQEKPAETAPPATPPSAEVAANEKIELPAGAKPIFEETGMASWYGAPYHNRRGSNGEIYDMNAMTAAHLHFKPLGSMSCASRI